MSVRLRSLAGPELIWIALYGLTLLLAAANDPPTVAGNQRLESIGYFLAIGGAAVSFTPLAWLAQKWWCLARVLVAGIIGLFFVIGTLGTAMDYGDSRNTGVGVAWMLFIGLGMVTLLFGCAIGSLALVVKRVLPKKETA